MNDVESSDEWTSSAFHFTFTAVDYRNSNWIRFAHWFAFRTHKFHHPMIIANLGGKSPPLASWKMSKNYWKSICIPHQKHPNNAILIPLSKTLIPQNPMRQSANENLFGGSERKTRSNRTSKAISPCFSKNKYTLNQNSG